MDVNDANVSIIHRITNERPSNCHKHLKVEKLSFPNLAFLT